MLGIPVATISHAGHPCTHLPPAQFHKAMANPNSIMIDAWNFNEALIGNFAQPPPEEGAEKSIGMPNAPRNKVASELLVQALSTPSSPMHQ
eukprot:gene29040-32241_t